MLDTWRDKPWENTNERRRNRAELMLNQNLGDNLGSLSLNVMSEDYWNSDRKMRSIGAGYSNNWAGVTWNLNYSYNRNITDEDSDKVYDEDQVFSLNITVPLDRWLSNSYATYSLNSSKRGDTSHNVGLNGTALEDQNLNWSIQESQTNHGQGNGGNASLDYQGTYARVNTGYSYDHDQRRFDYGIEGGAVVHAHGLTLSQGLGETVALVEAPGAAGVSISNQTGVKTDFRGYTIVPYVTPYRESTVSLETATLPDGADVELTSQVITPTRGAITRAHFDTRIGKRVLMTLTRPGGEVVPFGAMVTNRDASNATGAIVGDGGQVYLTGLSDTGTAIARWGAGTHTQCLVSWRLPEVVPPSGVTEINATCK